MRNCTRDRLASARVPVTVGERLGWLGWLLSSTRLGSTHRHEGTPSATTRTAPRDCRELAPAAPNPARHAQPALNLGLAAFIRLPCSRHDQRPRWCASANTSTQPSALSPQERGPQFHLPRQPNLVHHFAFSASTLRLCCRPSPTLPKTHRQLPQSIPNQPGA
jgi:hypothetical protein